MNLELSIIIPCYNASKTISRCLDSVVNHMSGVEIIIVDDCSSDNSVETIETYIRSHDANIRLLKNSVNMGAGLTRNHGIRYASKKFITFLDADDEFTADYAESVQEPMSRDFDVIVYNATQIFRNHSFRRFMFLCKEFPEGTMELKKALVYINGSTWGKIYRTDMIQRNQVFFGKTPRNEDRVFTIVALSYAQCVYYLDKELYLYHDVPDSLIHNRNLTSFEASVQTFEEIQTRLAGRGCDDELNSLYFTIVLYGGISNCLALDYPFRKACLLYGSLRKKYDVKDRYLKGYQTKYLLTFILFELRLFWLFKALKKIYRLRTR